MAAISANGHSTAAHDFDFGIVGFRYSDLFDAVKLKQLAEKFYEDVEGKDALLHSSLTKYIASHGNGFEKRVESKILTDAAPYLSDFIARMFGITRERTELLNAVVQSVEFDGKAGEVTLVFHPEHARLAEESKQ